MNYKMEKRPLYGSSLYEGYTGKATLVERVCLSESLTIHRIGGRILLEPSCAEYKEPYTTSEN